MGASILSNATVPQPSDCFRRFRTRAQGLINFQHKLLFSRNNIIVIPVFDFGIMSRPVAIPGGRVLKVMALPALSDVVGQVHLEPSTTCFFSINEIP